MLLNSVYAFESRDMICDKSYQLALSPELVCKGHREGDTGCLMQKRKSAVPKAVKSLHNSKPWHVYARDQRNQNFSRVLQTAVMLHPARDTWQALLLFVLMTK
jgi:hypothetical protein